MKSVWLCLCLSWTLAGAEKMTVTQLMEMAKKPADPAFASALKDTLGAKGVHDGTASLGHGADFVWAVEAARPPDLYVDDERVGTLSSAGSGTWFYVGKMRTGTSHNFYYMVNGTKMGGNLNIAAYLPESYAKPGVPKGVLSEKTVHTSKIYEGMTSNYWTYVPAQYDASKPACLMVWHDGQSLANSKGDATAFNVFDNLLAQGKIPLTIYVFIQPGTIGAKAMRSILYDTVSDKYPRLLRDELLPEVYAKYNIRKDGYSRAIAGGSSGGISSFNAAWFQQDQFARVLMWIASFSNLQQNHLGEFDGGNTYPYRVRKEDKRNIRVWSAEGAEDLENVPGGWPENNINMANALKIRDYDFHFSFSTGSHSMSHTNAELPVSLTWLWRGYDPAKTSDTFPGDPAEKDKPFYRIKTLNRQ